MSSIYFFSGPCGCGKTTLAKVFAEHLVKACENRPVYLIHGDDFQQGFVALSQNSWEDILRFNWECILDISRKALVRGMDVVVDYVVEDELPLVRSLAQDFSARLYYLVLTASEETIRQRLTQRGDAELIDRALFLKQKLESAPENQGFLFDNTGRTVLQELRQLDLEQYRML